MVHETGLDETKVDKMAVEEMAVDEIAVDEPGPHRSLVQCRLCCVYRVE